MEKFKWLFDMVTKYSKGNVLDLGCGLGYFCDYLQRKGFDVLAIDIREECLRESKRKNKNVKFIQADITKINLKEKFDTILLLGVIDYLVNIDLVDYLSSLKKNLRPQGRILIQVANSNSLQRRLKTFLNHEPVEPLPHYDFNNKKIKKIIEDAGYKILKFTSTKFWTFRSYRPYMPLDSLATEFFIVITPKESPKI